jgi:hypothetical protein
VLCVGRWRGKEKDLKKWLRLPFLTDLSPNQASDQFVIADVIDLDRAHSWELPWLWPAGLPPMGWYSQHHQISWERPRSHKSYQAILRGSCWWGRPCNERHWYGGPRIRYHQRNNQNWLSSTKVIY